MSLLTKIFPSRKTVIHNAARRAKSAKSAALGMEALDDRSLPSVTAALSPAGVLAITSDAASDSIMVYNTGDPSRVQVSRVTGWNGNQPYLAGVINLPASSVREIIFEGNGGDDGFNATNLINGPKISSINGGPGNDVLIGSSGNDVFHGSPGNDRYMGRQGKDQFDSQRI